MSKYNSLASLLARGSPDSSPISSPRSSPIPTSASTKRKEEQKKKYNKGLIQQNSRFWGDNRYWGGHFDDPDESRAKYDAVKGSHFPNPGSSTTSAPGKPPSAAPYSYKESLKAFAEGMRGKQKKKSSGNPPKQNKTKPKAKASKSK